MKSVKVPLKKLNDVRIELMKKELMNIRMELTQPMKLEKQLRKLLLNLQQIQKN